MTWNSIFILINMVWPILTRWTWFWPKITVLIQNGLEFIFYPMDSIFTENDCFDLKWPETYFLPRSTWFDLYWPDGLDFYGKRRLTREKYIFEFETFFSLNFFFGFLWIKIEIKITFMKILENPKLSYYNCGSFCFF